MEWLPPEHDGAILRPTTGSPIRSTRGGRRAISTLHGGRKKDSLPCSMILLDSAAADVVRSSTCLRRESLTPRGGVKRPRTASSMLPTTLGVAMSKVATWHEKEKISEKVKHQQLSLFRSRGAHHAGVLEQHLPSLLSSIAHTEHVIRGSAAVANQIGHAASSSFSAVVGGVDEAGAMAADEAVISLPPSPPTMRAVRANRPGLSASPPSVDRQQLDTTRTAPNLLNVGPCGTASSVCGSTAGHRVVGGHIAYQPNKSNAAVVVEVEERHHCDGNGDDPTTLSNEPLLPNEADPRLPSSQKKARKLQRQMQGTIHSRGEYCVQTVRLESEDGLPEEGTASRKQPLLSIVSSPDATLHKVKIDDTQVEEGGQQSGRSVVEFRRHQRLPLEGVARKRFLTTMRRSDDAGQSVRDDLVRYMEGVRANVGEDGTPFVTFPRNFDRVVGLMGRQDLDRPPQLQREHTTKDGAAGFGGSGGDNAGQGKTQDAPPPWTKYLLEEGLDRTKTFSRYRGMFADEQTGEDRVMHGLAKMRELDLRLARTIQKARDLRRMARDAAEEAERAAGVGLAQLQSCEPPLPDHRRGRGPVAIDDTPDIAPAATVRTLISNSVRTGSNAEQQPDPDAPPATSRSERSAASGILGAGGDRTRDKAFVTQTFRGPGRGLELTSGAASATPSSSISVAGSVFSHSSGAGTAGSRRKGNGSGGDGGFVSARGDGGASSGGGSSGISFVLKNKRHAAKARRRLTDEQENLVARFLGDADGYNEDGESTGDPSGIWAEITPYGGLDAHEDTARLAEIDAKILALGGALSIVDSNIKDDSAHGKNCDPTTVSANLLRHGKSNHSDNEAKHNTNEAAADQPPPLSPSRSARNTTAKCITPKGAIVPGEGTLREQRESRQIRDRERAIDIALEQSRLATYRGITIAAVRRRTSMICWGMLSQLRDSLFSDSVAGRGSREMAVDAALEQARSAPLSLQTGLRQGAGRVDSLLGGEGLQPVGEWEVKHALRRSEEELRGKDLASHEAIEELLTLVRRDATATNRDRGKNEDSGTIGRQREGCNKGDSLRDTNLDVFFVLRGKDAARLTQPKTCLRPCDGVKKSVSVNESLSSMPVSTPSLYDDLRGGDMTPGYESMSVRGTTVDKPVGRHNDNRSVVMAKRVRDRRQDCSHEEDQEALSNDVNDSHISSNTHGTATSSSMVSTSVPPAVESDSGRQHPHQIKTAKTVPVAAAASARVSPEVTALFRGPLLAPRVDPPIAGAAAAAVASGGGGNSRWKHKRSLGPTGAPLAGGLGRKFT